MNSELTKIKDIGWLQGLVLYDASSSACCRFALVLDNICTRRGFHLAPIQSPWVSECLGEQWKAESAKCEAGKGARVVVVTLAGQIHTGPAAVVYVARFIWWLWPVAMVAGLAFRCWNRCSRAGSSLRKTTSAIAADLCGPVGRSPRS